jgi:hypothetical protein
VGTTFEGAVKRHLAAYKQKKLSVTEDGVFLFRNRRYILPHILPTGCKKLNILPSVRDEFWSWHGRARPLVHLHRYFHHLNSSQALCFNLFFPFLQMGPPSIDLLSGLLGCAEERVRHAAFEFVPVPEEGTNFDFMLELESGRRILLEIKYTESGFGAAKDDDEHNLKFRSIYSTRLAERFTDAYQEKGQFFKNYQIQRNLWHLNLQLGDVVLFLVPRSNYSICRGLHVAHDCLRNELHRNVRFVYFEDLIESLMETPLLPEAYKAGALAEFKEKYFPDSWSP